MSPTQASRVLSGPGSPWRLAAAVAVALIVVATSSRPMARYAPPQGQQQPASKLPDVRLNRIIELLESGKPAFGTVVNDPSVESPRAIATSGFDFALLDMEHSSFDPAALGRFLIGMTNKAEIARKGNLQPDVTPIVRIPQYGYESVFWAVKQVLDQGVMGVMFPTISTKQQAIDAIAASRFPKKGGLNEPMGRRGTSQLGAASWFWGVSVPDYRTRAGVWPLDPKGEVFLLLMIETWEGIQNINEILDVPGIGGVYIGPGDLGLSLASQSGTPDLETAFQIVLKACLAKNVRCALPAHAPGDAAKRVQQGFKLMTVGNSVTAEALEGLRAGRAAVR